MFCVFCHRLTQPDLLIAENNLAAAFYDGFPVSPGHVLIVPKVHEGDFLALDWDTQKAIYELVPEVRKIIEEKNQPQGFNLGVNVGQTAGQTIAHAHFHVIPRYEGDVSEPKGGIRWIIPKKAKYWK